MRHRSCHWSLPQKAVAILLCCGPTNDALTRKHESVRDWFGPGLSFHRRGRRFLNHQRETCTAWTNRKRNAVVKGSFESWLVGFISGLNISGERDMVGGGDFDAIIAWMDQRCLTTPSDRIGIAALDLGMELASRAAKP
jgi:hypothetical protein